MFKVLTGKAPFARGLDQADTRNYRQHCTAFFSVRWRWECRKICRPICLACLAWNPLDRPSAELVTLELGRFLVGEPVRLKPKLYDDLLRRAISEHSNQAKTWESQSIISREERDSLEIIHRRLLVDEDHWIIDARHITPLQAILSASTWLTVVAAVLTVWMLRDELTPPWRWLYPVFFTISLLLAGQFARRVRENLAAATFLAGAALAIAPATLAILAEIHWFSVQPAGGRSTIQGCFHQLSSAGRLAHSTDGFGIRFVPVENDRLCMDHGHARHNQLHQPVVAVQLAGPKA